MRLPSSRETVPDGCFFPCLLVSRALRTILRWGWFAVVPFLVGCEFKLVLDKPHQDSSNKPGPVEHIDANERREAVLITPVIGPVQKENFLFQASVRSAFEEERFDRLEQMAIEINDQQLLTEDGSWKINHFYTGIKNRFGRSEDQFLTDQQRFENWMEQMPLSRTAKIAHADFLTDYAWFARGSGYAHTVTKEGWRKFRKRLEEALDSLKSVDNGGRNDPYWGEVALRVALGQGWSVDQYESLLEELKERYPKYWHYDVSRAYSLLPRWHGEPGHWEAYAEASAARGDGLGNETYARIAIRMVGFYGNLFRETEANKQRTLEGLRLLRDKYPDSLRLKNQIARMAVVANDRELSEEMFEKIGDSYVETCWINKEQFVHFRTWAQTGKW